MAATFKNFELAHRKYNLANFGLLPSGQNLDWIETNLGVAGAPTEEVPTGTKNGVNTVFSVTNVTYARSFVIKNRTVLNEDDGDYTIAAGVLTLAEAPESDDSILFLGWTA